MPTEGVEGINDQHEQGPSRAQVSAHCLVCRLIIDRVPHVVPASCLIRDWGDDSEDEQVQQNVADDSEVGVVWLQHVTYAVGVFQGLMKSVSELTKYRRRTAIQRLTQAPGREATTRVRREPHGQAATAETKRTRTRLVGALPRLSLRPSHCPRKNCTWEMGPGGGRLLSQGP